MLLSRIQLTRFDKTATEVDYWRSIAKMKAVTPNRLKSGLLQVRKELRRHGFFSPAVSEVRVRLTAFGTAYGYHHYGGSGEIHIPAVSLSRFSTPLGYP